MPVAHVVLPQDQLRDFCLKWKICELALFGSVLRDDFGPESDVDFLVSYSPDSKWSLLDEISMQDELEQIMGRRVDLVSRRAVENSANWIRRESILKSAESIYVAQR